MVGLGFRVCRGHDLGSRGLKVYGGFRVQGL